MATIKETYAANETLDAVMESVGHKIEPQQKQENKSMESELHKLSKLFSDEIKQWSETSRKHDGALIGERFIVLDKHKRAFSEESSTYKLELPDPTLNGVNFMTKKSAEEVCEHLSKENPDAAPYVARDFKDYAKEQGREALGVLKHINDKILKLPGVREKFDKLTTEQREWVDVFCDETHMNPDLALELTESLRELAVQHYALSLLALSGLSDQQERAQKAIEQQITELLDDVPNVKGALFLDDPRGTTVGVKFDSGASNSLTGSYKVPIDPDDISSLSNSFWAEHLTQSTGGELAKQLTIDGVPFAGAVNFEKKFVELSTMATQMGLMLSDGRYDEDRLNYASGIISKKLNWLVLDVNEDGRRNESQHEIIRDFEVRLDPRGAAVLLELGSGAANRISGGWGVPADEELLASFEEYPFSLLEKIEGMNVRDGRNNYVVLTIENTGNAAFADCGRVHEATRILDEAAQKIDSLNRITNLDFALFDINGNRVGQVKSTEKAPTENVPDGAVRCIIETHSGSVMDVTHGVREVTRKLRDLTRESARIERDAYEFPIVNGWGNAIGKLNYGKTPSLENDGVIDMNKALREGSVYLADDSYSGIADGEYRFVVTAPGFEPGYGQDSGDVWLVNAKGEIANGWEDTDRVRETMFRELKSDEALALADVVDGRVSFEEYERRFTGDDAELA